MLRISEGQNDERTAIVQWKDVRARVQPPLNTKPTLSILWKDARCCEVRGVVELRESDLPLQGARVKDLFPILNNNINSKYQANRNLRQVESFLLYGTRVNPDRLFDLLIPQLGLVPRFVAVMHVSPPDLPRARMFVYVKTLTNMNLVLHCEPSDTVGQVKAEIQNKLKISRELQRLIYAGKQLEDHLALSTYGITTWSQIRLKEALDRSDRPRSTRKVYQGLSIEGKCENPQCTAFSKTVICPKLFQEFNLLRDDDTTCPMCEAKVIPRTCGFYKCTWKFDGVQAKNGFSIISEWKDASEDNKYYRFGAKKYRGYLKWESLLIVVKPLNQSVTDALFPREGVKATTVACCICWSGLGSRDDRFVTNITCGHRFHGKCIDEWSGWCVQYGNRANYPICRGVLKAQAA